MSAKRLEKSELSRLLETLEQRGYEVLAPEKRDGIAELVPAKDRAAPLPEFRNTRLSVKSFVFPQSERLFVYTTEAGHEEAGILKEVPEPTGKRALLGVRPCDARALTLTDKLFLGEDITDPYYARKREQLLLLGLGCRRPSQTCFCHWTGGGPFSTAGLDLLMTDLDGAYLLDSVSDKGGEVIGALKLPDANAAEIEQGKKTAADALASMEAPVDPGPIKELPLMELYQDSFWEKASESCLNCAVCTFLCPTCTCFDLQDETVGCNGCRIRNWDSCMFRITTRHASGHNPRPTPLHRYRNRFMDKLKYCYDRIGEFDCVGCGRCIEYCPANIDIRELIQALKTRTPA